MAAQQNAVTPDQGTQAELDLRNAQATGIERPTAAAPAARLHVPTPQPGHSSFAAAQDAATDPRVVADQGGNLISMQEARQSFRVQPETERPSVVGRVVEFFKDRARTGTMLAVLGGLLPATLGGAAFFGTQAALAEDAEAGRTDRERPDKETVHRFDFTQEGDSKPVVLTFRTPEHLWRIGDHYFNGSLNYQLKEKPAEGEGAAIFYYVADPKSHQFQNKVYFFWEPLPEAEEREKPRDHFDRVVAKEIENVADRWGNTYHEYRGSLNDPKKFSLKIGSENVEARIYEFNVHPELVKAQNSVKRMKVLQFAWKGKLFTLGVTVSHDIDIFDQLAKKGFKLDDSLAPDKPDKEPVKLFEPMKGCQRFITLTLPTGFVDKNDSSNASLAGSWERNSKEGELEARIELSYQEVPKETRLGEEVVAARAALIGSNNSCEALGETSKLRIGTAEGYVFQYIDRSDDPPRHVRKGYVQMHDHIVTITMTSYVTDERTQKIHDKEFAKIVEEAKLWNNPSPR